jgi:hypothetical protein
MEQISLGVSQAGDFLALFWTRFVSLERAFRKGAASLDEHLRSSPSSIAFFKLRKTILDRKKCPS